MAVFDVLSSGWVIPAAAGACLILVMYLYAPFKVKGQQAKEVKASFSPIELPELPPEVAHAFQEASRGLVACGFHALGHLTHLTPNTGQNSYVSVWVNTATSTQAQIIGVCTPSPIQGLRVVRLVTFRTEFSDGTSIVTSNSSSLGVFPRDPKVSSVRCPGISDLSLLSRFHQARVDRDRAGRTASLARVKSARTRMEDEWTETYQRLVGAGYYSLDQTRGLYVPTLKGAFLMTYRLLPPFKQVQRLRRDRLTERSLRELGFGGMNRFRNSQSSPTLQ